MSRGIKKMEDAARMTASCNVLHHSQPAAKRCKRCKGR